jgi:ankyrin repeat protein
LLLSQQDYEQPIHFAAKNGHKEVVSLLLDRGADINAKNKVSIYNQYFNYPA